MATITAVKDRINQLNQANFQILCDTFLAREGYPGIVALGTKDGAEKTAPGTPDTYFCLNGGKYVFAEYTTQKSGLPTKIREDIDKCLDEEKTEIPLCEISEIVYCHTSSNINPADDRALKSICEEKGIKLTLIGIDLLAEKLMNYPVIIKDHLGINVDSEQIQTADDFVKQYNSNAMAATLDTVFLFREKEIDAIDKAFENVSTVLLIGPAGTGKTRLALEYAKKHASSHNEKLLCIHDRSIPMYEDLKMYFQIPGSYFIFVDDANQLSELEHVIEYANKEDAGYHVHILMTVRDYAVSKVKSDINGIIHYDVINISPFSDEEITSLMKKHYDIQNQNYLDRIVQISEGNARIAMLTGKIACDANRLDAINDVSDLYADYFGKALHESGVDSNSRLLVSAGIMAFLNAIHLDHIDPIIPILEKNGLTKADFVENVHILHEHEIVDICNDKGVRFSEQCMANFVLKYVFFDKKVIKLSTMIEACFGPYHKRTVQAVNTLMGVFRNTELRDYVKEEILGLWKKLEAENSPTFLEFLKTFFPVNEIQTLLIVQNLIDNVATVEMKADDIDTKEGKNCQNINDEIITILGGFSYLENLDSALDLFFQYYLKRPDLYMQFYHASTSFFSIDRHSAEHGYQPQIKYFTKILEYAQNGDNPLINLLFVDVASHFLQLEFSPCENTRNGKGITLYHIPLSLTTGVKEYRKLIWEHLLVLVSKGLYLEKVKGVLHAYGNAIHDCSKDVITSDANYICKLTKFLLSPESLTDCLIAQSLQKVFEIAEYQTNELQSFFSGPVYELYQIINGPRWDFDISYDERKKKKEDDIRKFITSATDKPDAFERILRLYLDSTTEKNRSSYEIAEGINFAMQTLASSEKDYIICVKMLLSSDTIVGIGILHIVEMLFWMLDPQGVFALLSQSHPRHRNEWLFAYYHEIPQAYIDKNELDSLYGFLMDDSDRDMQSSPYRDINFLDKYLPVDENVIITASKIILKKKNYSPFMVSMYFGLQFNDHHILPNDVIRKYGREIKLLERIYLFVVENDHIADCSGAFLHALFEADKSFVKEYAKWFVEKAEKDPLGEHDSKIEAFYQEEDYLDVLDYIVDEAISSLPFPSMTVPSIIKQFLTRPAGKEEYNKCDTWITHLIETYYTDKRKMQFLFEALTEISIERSAKYIALLVNCTEDYDVFDSISLIPSSWSWSGSRVPMYSSWVDHLEKLLSLFSGLKYIKHKGKVLTLIEYYRNKIKEEEISDIIEG